MALGWASRAAALRSVIVVTWTAPRRGSKRKTTARIATVSGMVRGFSELIVVQSSCTVAAERCAIS
jgi:hypothetical protein